MKITLATCEEWPRAISDEPLRCELEQRGHNLKSVPWTRDPELFEDSDLIVIRSCWDYHKQPYQFRSWLEHIARDNALIVNPVDIMLWNLNKRYLLDLAGLGVNIVPSVILNPNDEDLVRRELDKLGWKRAVRKPLYGQSGRHVELLAPGNSAWPKVELDGEALIQEFQADITDLGETLLVFFDGDYSHAIKRNLKKGEWRANSKYGSTLSIVSPSQKIIDQAKSVLQTVSVHYGWEIPVYARVDGLVRGDEFVLMELELIEPALGFDRMPSAASLFADRIEDYATSKMLRRSD